MIKRYTKKPVTIEAMVWTGENRHELWEFCTLAYFNVDFETAQPNLVIQTLEGPMQASIGDYIIKGIKGEYYPCKPDIFMLTYEEVIDEN